MSTNASAADYTAAVESTEFSDNIKSYLTLAITLLLLLERVWKNKKFVMKCNKDGCFASNRTPPISPEHSTDLQALQALERRLDTIQASIEHISNSLSGAASSSEQSTSSGEGWKKRKRVKPPSAAQE